MKTRHTIICMATLLATNAMLAQAPTDTMNAADLERTGSAILGNDWLEREGLTGDWFGARSWMNENGLHPFAELTGQFLANVDGGFDDGSTWQGLIDFGLEADLETMLGWEGGQFFINAFYFHGNDLSGTYVGDFNAVSNLFTDTDINVFNIFLAQSLFDDAVLVKFGQIAADDDFMVSETALLFINSCFGPLPIESGNIAAPIYPLAAPGAYLSSEPLDGWHVQCAVYSGDAGPNQSNNHGFDWRTGGSAGWAWFAETGVEYELLGAGTISVGGFYATGDFTDSVTGLEEEGLGGVYGMIEHEFLSADEDICGLSVFCRGGVSPDDDVATVSAYIDGGFALSDLLFDEDAFGLACSHTIFGDDYVNTSRLGGTPVTNTETVIEVTYGAAVTPWFSVQPDLQYIINPHFSDSDALVLGVRCALVL